MNFILVHFANWDATQDILEAEYNRDYDPDTEPNPKDFISYNENEDGSGFYEFITVGKYPATYSRSGNQSVICFAVTQEQNDFIDSLSGAIEILADDDNDPETEYQWRDPVNANRAKFLAVVGNDFFDGSGTIGDEDYIPPRNKLSVIY